MSCLVLSHFVQVVRCAHSLLLARKLKIYFPFISVHLHYKAKRKQSQAELEQAKQELIDGINQYNAEHENDTEVGLEVPDDKTETDRKKNDDE